MNDSIVRIPYRDLVSTVAQALVAARLDERRARTEAEIMVEADLLGVPSHGIRMLPPLLNALADGRVNPTPAVVIEKQRGATCLLNGDNGPGRSVALQAMQEAVSRAVAHGIGCCLAMHTCHWGRAHAYARHAAEQHMIGICMTNGMPCMAGWGAPGRVIGNNPIAIGIPRTTTDRPVILDMAMSQAAVGTVSTWLREGKTIPEGCGIDSAGRPSSDGRTILDGGAVLPFGGHKGAGLALMIELLTAALGGGLFGPEIEMGDRSGIDPDSSKLFIAIDPGCFSTLDVFGSRVEDFLGYLSKQTTGHDAFRWPGERGWQARDHNLKAGVPVHQDIVRELATAGVIC